MDVSRGDALGYFERIVHVVASFGNISHISQSFSFRFRFLFLSLFFSIDFCFGCPVLRDIPRDVGLCSVSIYGLCVERVY